jgi:ATP-dependent DNA helicase RecQ
MESSVGTPHPLRPFQREALQYLKSTQMDAHLACIAPTGSGKSLIFETLARHTKTRMLLLTPLVALAKQQKRDLEMHGVPLVEGAESPNLRGSQWSWVLSPESLLHSKVIQTLQEFPPNLVVVDEAHCIWEWGTPFRPAFDQLPEIVRSLGSPRTLWLSATLRTSSIEDLEHRLGKKLLALGSIELSKNLDLQIWKVPLSMRLDTLGDLLRENGSSGLLYCLSRDSAERVGRVLRSMGRKVLVYHAGLSREERTLIEEKLAKGYETCVVATSAFGMGVHFPQLKFAILWQPPPTLLSLVQIVGRVGRNSSGPAQSAYLLWDRFDLDRLNIWAHTRSLELPINQRVRVLRETQELHDFLQVYDSETSLMPTDILDPRERLQEFLRPTMSSGRTH